MKKSKDDRVLRRVVGIALGEQAVAGRAFSSVLGLDLHAHSRQTGCCSDVASMHSLDGASKRCPTSLQDCTS